MRLFTLLLILTPLFFSLSCSAKNEHGNEDGATEKSASEASKPEGVLTGAQNKTLKKSHQVDDLLQEANDKRLREADE